MPVAVSALVIAGVGGFTVTVPPVLVPGVMELAPESEYKTPETGNDNDPTAVPAAILSWRVIKVPELVTTPPAPYITKFHLPLTTLLLESKMPFAMDPMVTGPVLTPGGKVRENWRAAIDTPVGSRVTGMVTEVPACPDVDPIVKLGAA